MLWELKVTDGRERRHRAAAAGFRHNAGPAVPVLRLPSADRLRPAGRPLPGPGDAAPIRRRRSAEPPMTSHRRSHRAKEVAMTRRVRLWVAAVLIAAASLMAAVAVTATTGVNHAPAHVYLAGIVLNAID